MRVTLRDIARRVNLSHAAVSFVLNGRKDVSIPAATRERVLRAAKEMGYRPNRAAQALVRGRTHMVTLWRPLRDDGPPADAQAGFAELLAGDGFELVTRLFDFDSDAGPGMWEVDDWPVDGVLLLDCFRPQVAPYSRETDVPMVSLGTHFDPAGDHVGLDWASGVSEAIVHLKGLGAKRVAHLGPSLGASDNPRHAAFLSACEAHSLRPESITTTLGRHWAHVETAKAFIASTGAPDAIVAQSPELAMAARRALTELNLSVPEDVLLVAFDGSDYSELSMPSISSIGYPRTEMLRRSWEMLKRRICARHGEAAGEDERVTASADVHSEMVPTRLAIRDSSTRASR